MRSLRNEEGEKRKKRNDEVKIDIKVSSRRETERRNRMTLKAAFNYEDISGFI